MELFNDAPDAFLFSDTEDLKEDDGLDMKPHDDLLMFETPLDHGGDEHTESMAYLVTFFNKKCPEKTHPSTVATLCNAVASAVPFDGTDMKTAVQDMVERAYSKRLNPAEATCKWTRRQLSRVAKKVEVTFEHQQHLSIHPEAVELDKHYHRQVIDEFELRLVCTIGKQRGGCQFFPLIQCLRRLLTQVQTSAGAFRYKELLGLVYQCLSGPKFSEETIRFGMVCLLAAGSLPTKPLFDTLCKAVTVCLYFEQLMSPFPLPELGENPELFLKLCTFRLYMHEKTLIQPGRCLSVGEATWRWMQKLTGLHEFTWPNVPWFELL